jgi:hypothetical protein
VVRVVVPNSMMPKAMEHRKWMVQVLTPILCAAFFLFGLVALGRAARAGLRDRSAYVLTFRDIDCQPPPGMERLDFLDDVRTMTRQPEVVHLLDEDAPARLRRAFAVHPWVESVRRIEVSRPSQSKSKIQVEMVYRKPVLAVPLSAEAKSGKRMAERSRYTPCADGCGWRIVDAQAVLLPPSAPKAHLPIFIGDATPPAGPAGTHWGDARVAAAAKTVAFLKPHLKRLGLQDCEVETIEGELVLRQPGVRIVWGHAPGQEREGEAPAKVKLRRLLDYHNGHDGLESLEHDVRLLAYQGHFPLALETPPTVVSLYESSQSPSNRNCDHVSNSSRSWRSCFSDANAPSAKASSR